MSLPRYERYKDSGVEWLGEVPERWRVERLKWLAGVFPSNVDKKEYPDETPVRLCNYTDVYYHDEIRDDMSLMQATASAEQIAKFGLRKGDTVLTKDSETADDIAISAYVPEDLPGVVCGYHLAIARPRPGTVGAFLKRALDAHYVRAQAEVGANGLTRVGLSQDALASLRVTIPAEGEQTTIAAFIAAETRKIDVLIQEQRHLIELLKEKRQAVISHAVTKGLNPSAPMKDSGIEWFGRSPKHWEPYRLATVFAEVNEAGEEDLPILSVSIHYGASDKQLDEDDLERKVTRSEDEAKYKKVAPGDLVYNMMRAWQGGFGTIVVLGMVSPAYVVARPSGKVSARFIELLLRTPPAVEELRRHSRGVTDFRLRLYWEEFKNIRVCLPPPGEQEAILSHVDQKTVEFDELMDAAEGMISLLRERRSAVISSAVTGKVDVRPLAAKPVASEREYSSGFARQLLAAEILDRYHDQPTMGRIKLQKLIHLCEHHGQLTELESNYVRKQAGPFDSRAMAGISQGLRKLKWFEEIEDGGRHLYKPLERRGQHKQYLAPWERQMPRVNDVLALLGTAKTKECEIVATLYAAWNDLMIEGAEVTDAAILHQASSAEQWHKNKEKIAAERWRASLAWMKENQLIPTGFGRHTTQDQSN